MDDTAVTEAFESDEMLPIVMELKEEFREIIILYYYEEFSVGGNLKNVKNSYRNSKIQTGKRAG